MTTNLLKASTFVLATCLFASCMDDKYDLDSVDMTIGTSGDLTLPTNSTGGILLKNIMDLEEDGVIQIDSLTGEYFLVEKGDADVPRIDITPITISRPVLSSISASIALDIPIAAKAQNQRNIFDVQYENLPLEQLIEIIRSKADELFGVYNYTIQDDDGAYYRLDDGVSGEVPKEVVELTSVSFVDSTTLDAKIVVSLDTEYEFINKVHLDNLSLTIPKGLHISKAEFIHYTENEDGNVVLEVEQAKSIDNENGKIVLTETDENTIIGRGNEIHIRLTVGEAVTGMGGFVFEDNIVSLLGEFRVDGTFRIQSSEFNLNALTLEQAISIIENNSYDMICPNTVFFEGGAEFVRDISVSKFAGKVKTDVGNIAPIELNDLPDFLNDPEVKLDLANPAFFVEVNNPLPASAKTSIVLTSKYDDGRSPITRTTGDIAIPANEHVVFCLANNPSKVTAIPAAYAHLRMIPVTIEGLSDLLKELPKQIHVDVADITMQIDSMPIPSFYDVKISYNVFTPLEFGEEFKLVYQGTEEGLSDDMEDVDKLDSKGLRLQAVAETNFPLNLTLHVDGLDRNNNSLNGTVIDVDSIYIMAHTGPEEMSEQNIMLNIKPMPGHTVSEFLRKLDKFHYRAVAEANGSEGKLKDNAYIKLKNIRITLLGGVSYDAN